MSKEQIELRIRSLFYFLFGIIFTGLFILISTYINISNEASLVQKKQVQKLLLDGVKIRERQLFEDYMTQNYASISQRMTSFLTDQGIKKFEISIFGSEKCLFSTNSNCFEKNESQFGKSTDVFKKMEILDQFVILAPLKGWGNNVGTIQILVPLSQISSNPKVIDTFLFYIIPFAGLVILAFAIFRFAEKHLIRPTIKRIIETEKLNSQRELLSQFAHDIRSPLAVLNIAVQSFEKDIESSKELIISATNRIGDISEDLLSTNKRIVNEINTDLHQLVDEISRDKRLEFKNRNCQISAIIPNEVRGLNLNRSDLYRILSNLINNSIESVPESIIPRIELSVLLENKDLHIILNDNGSGLDEKKIPKILSGNYSTKQNGNGLGISGCLRWLKENNGDLSIKSVIGIGTQVSLKLPNELMS